MIRDPTQMNIEMYCGILDVYGDDVISFTSPHPGVCNVKERIDSDVVSDFDIQVTP